MRGAAAAVAWGVAAPWAAWAVIRLLGLERGTPLVQLLAFTPYVAALAILPVATALILRQWWVAGFAGLVLIALVGCVVPRLVGTAGADPGVALTVMSANLRYGEADAATIVGLVRDRQVDVLVLQEYTENAHSGLMAAGLGALLPFGEGYPGERASGSALFARFPVGDAGVRVNVGGFRQAHGVVRVPGTAGVFVVSAHPAAPGDAAAVPLWTADLRDEPAADPANRATILAGDFNATLDHVELRRLLGTGYRDAAASLGRGLTPTWPYAGPRAWVTPRIPLDHVLVDRRIEVRDFAAYQIPGSDHRAVVATVGLARVG